MASNKDQQKSDDGTASSTINEPNQSSAQSASSSSSTSSNTRSVMSTLRNASAWYGQRVASINKWIINNRQTVVQIRVVSLLISASLLLVALNHKQTSKTVTTMFRKPPPPRPNELGQAWVPIEREKEMTGIWISNEFERLSQLISKNAYIICFAYLKKLDQRHIDEARMHLEHSLKQLEALTKCSEPPHALVQTFTQRALSAINNGIDEAQQDLLNNKNWQYRSHRYDRLWVNEYKEKRPNWWQHLLDWTKVSQDIHPLTLEDGAIDKHGLFDHVNSDASLR